MINFRHTSSALADADLDNVEERFGFKFPAEFRDHYLRVNGGCPDKNRLVTDRGTYTVHEFLAVKYGKPSLTLEHDIQQMKVDQCLIPEHLVEFAVDPFGNYYCFSTRENDFGAIYFFAMDGNRKGKADYLSPSLTDFLNRLTSKKAAGAAE